jgi:hypothetical protein
MLTVKVPTGKIVAPVANVTKLFAAVSYDFSLKARVFVPGKLI